MTSSTVFAASTFLTAAFTSSSDRYSGSSVFSLPFSVSSFFAASFAAANSSSAFFAASSLAFLASTSSL